MCVCVCGERHGQYFETGNKLTQEVWLFLCLGSSEGGRHTNQQDWRCCFVCCCGFVKFLAVSVVFCTKCISRMRSVWFCHFPKNDTSTKMDDINFRFDTPHAHKRKTKIQSKETRN